MASLTGKVALITGAAGGIGSATARRLATAGANLALGDLAPPATDTAPPGALCLALDVTDEASWRQAIAAILARFGRLDVLVNNAGIFEMAPLAGTSVAMFMRTVQINQLGVFLGMREAAPAMQATGGGSIVNISSVAGLTGAPNITAYAASKWAVRGMTKTAAVELAPHKIRVNSVHPGAVDTQMIASQLTLEQRQAVASATPLGRLAQPEDVAAMVLFLASEASAYSTGSEFVCDGGASAS